MLLNSIHIVVGLGLLAGGSVGLVRGSTGMALRLGVTSLVIGLTVVAFGTGSPELILSVEAARAGDSGIALGNVVGSNISNIALVLGLAALVRPIRVRSELIRREAPIMIVTTFFLWLLLLDGGLSRTDGLALLVGAVLYIVSAYLIAAQEERRRDKRFDEKVVGPRRPLWVDALLAVSGLAALLIGARLLLAGATSVAEELGLPQVVIGLTVVAVGTSLPELATSIASAAKNEPDVAFGNVMGSNVLNILAVLGIAALIRPFEIEGLRQLDLLVMVGIAVVVWPLMWRRWVLDRLEGAALLVGYAVYLYSLVPKG